MLQAVTPIRRSHARVLAAAALLWALAFAAVAQPRQFRHYTAKDGLPQSQVLVAHQDALGFLWVGTYGGLGRFDGRSFLQYSTSEGLSSNLVQAIASTPDGTVWAGQSHGLCALRPQRVRFECVDHPGIADTSVQALRIAPGGLWVGTREGLLRLRKTGGRFDATRVLTGDIAALADDGAGGLWVGSRRGLWRLDRAGRATELPLPASHVDVRALLVDRDRLWIGTTGGLLLHAPGRAAAAPDGLPAAMRGIEIRGLAIGPEGALLAATRLGLLRAEGGDYALLKRADGLSNDDLYGVLRDREGIVWIAGDGGLSSYVAGALTGYTERDGLMQDFARAINEDALGRLWLGTRQGVQVVRLQDDGRIAEQLRITLGDGLLNDRIYDIELPSAREAWLATGGGLAHWREGEGVVRVYTTKDGLPSDNTRSLHRRRDGSLLIATLSGVAVMRDGRIAPSEHPELADAQVISIVEDRAGQMWLGSLKKGLLMLGRDGRVRMLKADDGLSDETIWHLAPDAKGGLWIGTNGDGLFHRDAAGTIRRYTTREGLVDNFVWQVLVDREGDVWSYTNRGLARFDGTDFTSYGLDDGLLHLEGGATAALQTASGERWFASNEGLMRYTGTDRGSSAVRPAVTIYQAMAGGQAVLPGSALPPGTRNFEFNFAAPLLRRNSDLRYRYRLRGADDEWVESRSYRPIAYANLGPGRYVFEAAAKTAGQPWTNDVARFAFEIRPPLWRTPPVLALGALGIAALAWLGFRLRVRRMVAKRRELESLVAERTQALARANEQLEHASFTDPLTELRNRRYMAAQVAMDVAQVTRAYSGPVPANGRDIIFMMIDIDHFKQINDTHGHGVGDLVLREYARIIRSVIRESDYAVRWGGEEFLLVARNTDATQCAALAERLIDSVRATRFPIDEAGTTIRSTCSVGVSHLPFVDGEPNALDWEHVVDVCDAAVYLAKAQGRDGWVGIHGVRGAAIGDPDAFMRRLKRDPLALAKAGCIRLGGSRRLDGDARRDRVADSILDG